MSLAHQRQRSIREQEHPNVTSLLGPVELNYFAKSKAAPYNALKISMINRKYSNFNRKSSVVQDLR